MTTTIQPGFHLRFLGFFGPQKQPATVTFGSGLNVLYGASNTGKSFIVETIDFMLGGSQPLRDIPQRLGYDRILLGIETLERQRFTIWRSVDGGGFRLYEGLHKTPPADDVQYKELSQKHSDKNEKSLSWFLLGLCGLEGKRVRKNAGGKTNSLSFRSIARLMIVNEKEITQEFSPLYDGNPNTNTQNFSTFKLLLTGIDDSALVPDTEKVSEDLSRDAQLELLNQLLKDHRDRLEKLTKTPDELEDQLERLNASIHQQMMQVNTTEAEFQESAGKRRNLRRKLEEGRERYAEIIALLERFKLLDQHYVSDIERLRALEEGGTLFNALGPALCPLCGAAPEHHNLQANCDGNVSNTINATRKEIGKIELLRKELAVTIFQLDRERESTERQLSSVTKELQVISDSVDTFIAPRLSSLRKSYSEFADTRAMVREAMALYATVQDIERRRTALTENAEVEKTGAPASTNIPTAITNSFAQTVESILSEWHFPESGRVYFDTGARDLVISDKPRNAFGKGLRAITHAAFTLGLLDFCRSQQTPHTGFIVLDSPLLAYREPDGEDDNLLGTDLQEKFYDYLQNVSDDKQVIIVENIDPPDVIIAQKQSLMFTQNPNNHGRYGFFPHITDTTV